MEDFTSTHIYYILKWPFFYSVWRNKCVVCINQDSKRENKYSCANYYYILLSRVMGKFSITTLSFYNKITLTRPESRKIASKDKLSCERATDKLSSHFGHKKWSIFNYGILSIIILKCVIKSRSTCAIQCVCVCVCDLIQTHW